MPVGVHDDPQGMIYPPNAHRPKRDADKAEDEAREPSATRTPQPVEPAPAPAPAAPQPVEESTVAASQADTEARPSGQCRPPWC